jgi:hypothetical protein
VVALIALLLAVPAHDTFDEPLDPELWYIGVPDPPRRGSLRIPKDGWIVTRGFADDGVARVEIVFRHKGGTLGVSFYTAKEPLSSPVGEPLIVKKAPGVRTLVLTREGATLDGVALPWKGALSGTFRLRAADGEVEIDEVRVEPRAQPRRLTALERATVHFTTTPQIYRDGRSVWIRQTFILWDVEVALLVRQGFPQFDTLRAPVKGAPVLATLVTAGKGDLLAARAANSKLAMLDWGDERANKDDDAYRAYLVEQYAILALLLDGQRALNAALGGREDLEPLVYLAAIRHADNAHAALALAETEHAAGALRALRKALAGQDPARVNAEALRKAAGDAARSILGDPPAAWPGFTFEPKNRYLTIARATEIVK